MALAAGRRLGAYEILGTLGEGGMGLVYRARDTRLNRTVAIKVLPVHLAADPAARARFVREGQALAALSHPNLVALYDVGTEGDVSYAVMELVDGETLHARMAGHPLPIRRVIDYAAQIARGLSAAHEKGIVHRDLKPTNVIVTADGRVKILDFGLAKAGAGPVSDSGVPNDAETAMATDPGTVLGTVGYMAPEQVRGQATDTRADIFSFGAVLYEMAAGRRAFARDTAAETMTAILKEDPPDIAPERAVPPALDRIIRHCLEKRREERFRSAADLAFQLETLTSPSAAVESVATDAPRARRSFSGLVTIAALVAGLAIGWTVLARFWPLSGSTAGGPVIRTTLIAFSGRDHSPAASPDGRTIAFVSGRDGTDKIWLKQLATGEEAALTEGSDYAPRFSPDGATLIFAKYEGTRLSLYRVPVVGGQPRKLLEQATEGEWSQDGTRLAFVRQRTTGEWVLGVAAGDGGQVRESSYTTQAAFRSPRWSPDGRSIVVAESGIQSTISDRFVKFEAETLASTPIEPVEKGGEIAGLAFLANGDFVYGQNPNVTSYTPEGRIVRWSASGGGRTLAWIPATPGGLDVLGDGSIVVATQSNRQNLRESEWTGAGLSEGRWLTRGTSSDRQPAYSPDGKWVVYSSTRNGNLDLWMTSTSTGESRRLTDDRAEDWDPAFTPDGKSLLWSSNRSGHFEIWIAEADGRSPRQLTKDGIDAENPTATPDSEWIVYGAGSAPTQGVWKIRRDGSQTTQLVSGLVAHPETSPDGRFVVYHSNVIGHGLIHVVRVSDGQPAMPAFEIGTSHVGKDVSGGRARWRADGHAIVFVGGDPNGVPCLFTQDFVPGADTSSTRRMLKKSDLLLVTESFGISPDGRRVTVSYLEDQISLMKFDGVVGVKK